MKGGERWEERGTNMVAQPSLDRLEFCLFGTSSLAARRFQKNSEDRGSRRMGGVQYPFYIISPLDFRFLLRSYLFTTFDFFRSFFFPVSVSLFAALCLLNDFLLFFLGIHSWGMGLM